MKITLLLIASSDEGENKLKHNRNTSVPGQESGRRLLYSSEPNKHKLKKQNFFKKQPFSSTIPITIAKKLTSCIPKTQIDRLTVYNGIGVVIIKHCGHVLARKRVRCVRDEHARFTNAAVSYYHNFYVLTHLSFIKIHK